MMELVFNLIMNASEDIEFKVKLSFLEIYNEKIQDLLNRKIKKYFPIQKKKIANLTNLQIKEDKNRGIFIHDCTEIYVNSIEQMKLVMKTGSENR